MTVICVQLADTYLNSYTIPLEAERQMEVLLAPITLLIHDVRARSWRISSSDS